MSIPTGKGADRSICRNWSQYPSIRDVIVRIREMDLYCFGSLQPEDWGTVDGWLAIAQKNPYMNVCLEVDGVIMGSVHWLWLNKHGRDELVAGHLRDGQIRPEHTVGTPPLNEPVYLYLLSMMVHPDCQGHGYLRKLWNHAISEHTEWRKKGVRFEEALALAWSDAGRAILASAGGVSVGSDGRGHNLLRLPVPVKRLLKKDDPQTPLPAATMRSCLRVEELFPEIPNFVEVNLNDWLRTHCDGQRPATPEAYQRALNQLNTEAGAPTYGGWMENREWMWSGSYMEEEKNFTHLGVDVYLRAGTPVRLPFSVKVIDTFFNKDDEVGWGGRITVQRDANSPAIVFGHLEPKLPEVGTIIPAGNIIGRLATWPENGNVFEHLHIQLVRPDLVPTLDWHQLDGYGFPSDAADFPHPFQTEL